ncbi:hypothetical protein CK203_088905 [Vitis vinifera]|uniref:Uncharacterized protein n=1 Tax=Vitis vinifera TaxID=29760 RepID=A0A438D0S4_VITVI|nr:hypothetical protein CK203_088905 [Vitis vinifera]
MGGKQPISEKGSSCKEDLSAKGKGKLGSESLVRVPKRCFGEGTSSTREDADNHQRFHLNASILSKGKEKLRKFSKDEDRVDSKGFKGFVHRGSSVTVFPTSPVTREKGFNFVGTCEMRVVENFGVSSTPHSQSFLSSLSSFPPSSGLALPPLSPFVPVLPVQSFSLSILRILELYLKYFPKKMTMRLYVLSLLAILTEKLWSPSELI